MWAGMRLWVALLLLMRHVTTQEAGQCSADSPDPANQCTSKDSQIISTLDLSATEAIALLCSRQLTAQAYAEAALARIEATACLNAWAYVNASKVLEDAAAVDAMHAAGQDVRPLCGLAFAVKDNIDVLGYPTGADTPALKGRMPPSSSPLVTRLQQAHGVVLGKTRMHELAFGGTTINVDSGPTLNPYQNHQHVGGSSGGTGAAIAARTVTAGFCSDTEGSCRIPASITGTVGFRPTRDCYNAAGGIVPMTTSRDTAGIMARTVADVSLFDAIFNDCPSTRPADQIVVAGLRMGVPKQWWEGLGKETHPAFSAALQALTQAGAVLVEVDVQHIIDTYREEANANPVYIYEMPRELARYLYQHGYDLTLNELVDQISAPIIRKILLNAMHTSVDSSPTPAEYFHMINEGIPKLAAMWNASFDDDNFDVIVTPTTPISGRPIDQSEPYLMVDDGTGEQYFYSEGADDVYCRTAAVDPIVRAPGLSIPIGLTTDGMPIGLQLQARPGGDGLLLAVGEAVEALFAATPSPPSTPACAGCTAHVSVQPVTWDGTGLPQKDETWSSYTLAVEGKCELQSQMRRQQCSNAQ